MAPHSSTLAWRIPGTGEPGGLPSMRSHRVGHDWSDLAAAALHLPCSICTWWSCQVVLVVRNLPASTGDIHVGWIPVSGRSPRGRHCNPLQYSCLENPMDYRGSVGPGGLQSMGSQRVGHDWSSLAHTQAKDFNYIYKSINFCHISQIGSNS